MKISIFLLFLLSILTSKLNSFKLTPQPTYIHPLAAQFATSIKYQQRIGSCISSTQLSGLNKIINQASIFFKSDYQLNLKHIKQSMDQQYGTQNTSYIVFIIKNQTKSNNYYQHFYNVQACNYVLLAKGINKINPTWSYLLYKITEKPSYTLSYIHSASKGQGITNDIQTIINNVILSAQGKQSKCNCLSITISSNLQKFDNQQWNTICMPADDVYGYILSKNKQWIMTHPKHCFYVIYAKQ